MSTISSIRLGSSLIRDPFQLHQNLGIITVPEDYNPQTCLGVMRTKAQKAGLIHAFDPDITDQHFHPSYILRKGMSFRVGVLGKRGNRCINYSDVLGFINGRERGVYLGAQGLALVFQQKRQALKRMVYSSPDHIGNLWLKGRERLSVTLTPYSEGTYAFDTRSISNSYERDERFLYFVPV